MQLSQPQSGKEQALPARPVGGEIASDKRGAIAIEFALLAPVLAALLLAMAEVGVALVETQRMHDTVSAMARRVALQQITIDQVEQLVLAELEPAEDDQDNQNNGNGDQAGGNSNSDSSSEEEEPSGYWVNVMESGDSSAAIEVGIPFSQVSVTALVPFLKNAQLRAKVDVSY